MTHAEKVKRRDTLNVILHVLFGLIFLSFPIVGSPDFPFINRTFGNPMGRAEVISQVLLLAYFYVNFFYIIPRFFFRKKYLQFGLITLGVLFLLLAWMPLYFKGVNPPRRMEHFHQNIQNGIDTVAQFHRDNHHHHRHPHFHRPNRFLHMMINRNMYMFFFVFSVALLVKITQKWRESEKEKMNSELSYLKAQINPHFLFNTLNSIYSLSIVENANNTADAVIRLSSMMRYVTQEALGDKVSLEKELDYINSYIQLQKLRFGDTIKLNVSIDKAGSMQIVPLLLISFIENAFKYGVNPQENSEITITIGIKENLLHLFVKNNKVHVADEEELGSGVGLQNTINRLNLAYDGQYELVIDDNEKTYSVDLQLILS